MQDAPDDLYVEACKQLGRPPDDPEIAHMVARLRAPLHPNCYLSPTQFAEKTGLPLPSRAEEEGGAPADAAATDTLDAPRQHVGTDTLDAEPPASSDKALAELPHGPRRLLKAVLIVLLLAFAFWAAALALSR